MLQKRRKYNEEEKRKHHHVLVYAEIDKTVITLRS